MSLIEEMLRALEDTAPEELVLPSPTAQKEFILKWVNTLTVDDRKEMARLIINNHLEAFLKAGANGCVINLDAIPADVVEKLYQLVVFKKDRD